MIATLNKSKTALTINRQDFKLALAKIGAGIDKQIASLKKAKQSYDPAEIAQEVLVKQISLKPLLRVLTRLKKPI